ncbi:DUF4352 domain-containing protein [Actinoplanes sp. NPDC051513]|uniref:DUF4352 domain-containing protein n=1 Tax=Actinoplanes sp. NPDC051513 TaxID=3363908 RepID=UPI0037ADB391
MSQEPQPKRKRDPLLIVAVAVLFALSVSGVALANFHSLSEPVSAPRPEPKSAGMNTPVRDGKLEFTVTQAACGSRTLGDDAVVRRARGEYCLVGVTVKNLGIEARTFAGGSQTALDAKNVAYPNDDSAEFPVNPGVQAFLEQIGPGRSAKGTLVFDVPTGTKLTAVELRDSFLTAGVRVRLS